MISIDALRADCTPRADESVHLRSLGLRPPRLPAFSELVHTSSVFSQAFACSSYTTACHASLFTGLAPAEHGVRAFSVTSLSSEVRTLAEVLRDAGYATCAMIDKPLLFQPCGLLRGFQACVTSDEEALAWWDSYEGTPRFLFMHVWDIHTPYGMPFGLGRRGDYSARVRQWEERLRSRGIHAPTQTAAGEEGSERGYVAWMQIAWHNECGYKAAIEDYIAGVETFDGGRLADLSAALRQRRITSEALLVVTADHGEGRDWPPSQLARHGSTLKDDQIHIPLFIQCPGIAGQQRVTGQVSQADITPTILDALDLLSQRNPSRSLCNGRSLLPLLRGESLPERAIYAEMSTEFKDPMSAAEDPASRRDPTLRYRILRYPHCKYWLVGKPVVWDDALLAAPPEAIVKTLFLDVLGRRPGADEEKRWTAQAQAIAAGDVARRRALVQRFEGAGEFRNLPKYSVFDLTGDPLEVKPRDARAQPALWAAFEEQIAIMDGIERSARAGGPLISSAADQQVILERLRDLGYVE